MKKTNTTTSRLIENCQVCGEGSLKSVLFLGYLPPVNQLRPIGSRPEEQESYPAELLTCSNCHLVQLGLAVSPEILFPSSYPYTSSTTKVLRDNFSELFSECTDLINLNSEDLVVDIGSNDGNLLQNFTGKTQVLGVTPEKIGELAIEKGIPTVFSYFDENVVNKILSEYASAKVITATNVFAHIDHLQEVMDNVRNLMASDGVFISESHYLISLIETLQYDTVYHEHLRYYSLSSLDFLFQKNDLEIFHAKRIPTHGGSIRVYACRKGTRPIQDSVDRILSEEKEFGLGEERLRVFREDVAESKVQLIKLLAEIKLKEKRVMGISAPSRGSTLVNYCGIDEFVLDAVVEVKGSYKIGRLIPGTQIPILDEKVLFEEQPDYALLLSWHMADELMPKLWEKGFKGDFIVPLPEPVVVRKPND